MSAIQNTGPGDMATPYGQIHKRSSMHDRMRLFASACSQFHNALRHGQAAAPQAARSASSAASNHPNLSICACIVISLPTRCESLTSLYRRE